MSAPPDGMRRAWPHRTVPVLLRQSYTHGSWMGAGGHVLSSPVWAAELQTRTPAAYRRVAAAFERARGRAHTGTLLAQLENSPVVAAYGTISLEAHIARLAAEGLPAHQEHIGSVAHNPLVLEWDVHLSPATIDTAVRKLPGADVALRRTLARELATEMVCAHGSMWAVLGERLLGIQQYAAVKSASGDMTVPVWLLHYFAVLRAHAPALFSKASKRDAPLVSVFLDVKSAAASAAVLGLLVEGLNARGVHVWGVGSFVHKQVAAAGAYPATQHVRLLSPPVAGEDGVESDGAARDLPPPIRFFIVGQPGEIQHGVLNGSIPHGADILFNGGTLLAPVAAGAAGSPWTVDRAVFDALSSFAAVHDLRLGLYCQEPSMDSHAVTEMALLVNSAPAVFQHGWAYAGLPGQAAEDIPRGRGWGMAAPPWYLAILAWTLGDYFSVPWKH
jgi:hypothetical protein